MALCPSCTSPLTENASFCAQCGAQARCKPCGQDLAANAKFCSACGTPVGQGNTDAVSAIVQPEVPVNKIRFSKKGKDFEFEGDLTTELGINMSQVWGMVSLGQMGMPLPSGNQTIVRAEARHPELPFPSTQPPGEDQVVEGTVHEQPPAQSDKKDLSDRDKMREIFKYQGEDRSVLKLDETHLEASGQLDYSRRLTLLFIYAHELEGRQQIPRSALKAIIEHNAVHDKNFLNWLSNYPDISVEGDKLSLLKKGRQEAQKILNEVIDSATDGGWTLEDRGQKRSSSDGDSKGGEQAKQSRKASGLSKDVQEWVSKWKDLNFNIEAFTLLNDKSVADKMIFGLWAINKAKDNADLVSRGKITKFLYSAFGIQVSDGGGTDTSIAKEGRGKIIKSQGGYQLLDLGVSHAEQMCNFKRSAK